MTQLSEELAKTHKQLQDALYREAAHTCFPPSPPRSYGSLLADLRVRAEETDSSPFARPSRSLAPSSASDSPFTSCSPPSLNDYQTSSTRSRSVTASPSAATSVLTSVLRSEAAPSSTATLSAESTQPPTPSSITASASSCLPTPTTLSSSSPGSPIPELLSPTVADLSVEPVSSSAEVSQSASTATTLVSSPCSTAPTTSVSSSVLESAASRPLPSFSPPTRPQLEFQASSTQMIGTGVRCGDTASTGRCSGSHTARHRSVRSAVDAVNTMRAAWTRVRGSLIRSSSLPGGSRSSPSSLDVALDRVRRAWIDIRPHVEETSGLQHCRYPLSNMPATLSSASSFPSLSSPAYLHDRDGMTWTSPPSSESSPCSIPPQTLAPVSPLCAAHGLDLLRLLQTDSKITSRGIPLLIKHMHTPPMTISSPRTPYHSSIPAHQPLRFR
ncbi:hypothetical protein CF326_g9083 [Tilletia indica]|nr:hypothetical protein CF326_g9083 [Tilletia indica]